MNKKREPAHPTLPHPPGLEKIQRISPLPLQGGREEELKQIMFTMPYILNSSSSKHTRVALI